MVRTSRLLAVALASLPMLAAGCAGESADPLASLPDGKLAPRDAVMVHERKQDGNIMNGPSVDRDYDTTLANAAVVHFYETEMAARGWKASTGWMNDEVALSWTKSETRIQLTVGADPAHVRGSYRIDILKDLGEADLAATSPPLESPGRPARQGAGLVFVTSPGLPSRFVLPKPRPETLIEEVNNDFRTWPRVLTLDGAGVVRDRRGTLVSLALGQHPDGATLTCSDGRAREAVGAVVSFLGCSVDTPGWYTLVASSQGAANIESERFEVIRPKPQGPLVPDGPAQTMSTIGPGVVASFEFTASGAEDYRLSVQTPVALPVRFSVQREGHREVLAYTYTGPASGVIDLSEANGLRLPAGDYVVFGHGVAATYTARLVTLPAR